MTDPQIAEIAAGLSEAEKLDIQRLSSRWDLYAHGAIGPLPIGVCDACKPGKCEDGECLRLTPLGQSVAAYLKEQSNAD